LNRYTQRAVRELKSSVFCFGAGMLVISLAFYCAPLVYSAEPAPARTIEPARRFDVVFPVRYVTEKIEPSDSDVIKRAAALGMVFPPEKPAEPPSVVYADVIIPRGATALEIAGILAEKGVVNDSDAFVKYVTEKDAANKLLSGGFSLPINGDFDQIYGAIAITRAAL
jgi:hypothetical protein